MKGDFTFMKKRIYAACALLLVFAMIFSFAACDAGAAEETEATTVQAKTEMPTDKAAIVNYYNSLINAVKVKKPAVKKSQSNENISGVVCGTEDGERNTLLEKSVPTLKKFILSGTKSAFEDSRNAETKYGEDLTQIFPVAGQSWSSMLSVDDVATAECTANEDNSERTLTITLKSNQPVGSDETGVIDEAIVKKAFNLGSVDDRNAAVKEFRDKLSGYISFTDIESLTYTECTIVCVIDTKDDVVKSVEYTRNEKITTTITGEGTLKEIGTIPCSFIYTYGEKYEMDWVDPSVTTTNEAD